MLTKMRRPDGERRSGMNASVTMVVPIMLVEKSCCIRCLRSDAGLLIPALLIRTSRLPKSLSIDEAAALMLASSVMSSWIRDRFACGFSSWICRRAFWPFSDERDPMITW